MVIKPRYCTRSGCRKNWRFANHLVENCFFEPTTAHNKLQNNFQGSSFGGTFRNQQSTNRNNNYTGGNGIHKGNNIINSGAKPLGKRYNNNFQPFTNSSGPHQRSGPNGYVKTNYKLIMIGNKTLPTLPTIALTIIIINIR